MDSGQVITWNGILDMLRASQVIQASSLAALTFLVYDICLTFKYEVAYIWSKPNTSHMKWLFLFVRYFAIAALASQNHFSLNALQMEKPLEPKICKRWFIWITCATQTMMTISEIPLLVRVYALYNSRRMGLFLVVLFWIVLFISAALLGLAFPKVQYSEGCLVSDIPSELAYTSFSGIFSQLIIVVLTVWKCLAFLRGPHGSGSALISVVMRDGTWTFVLMLAIYVVNFGLLKGLRNIYASVISSWMIAVASSVACHIVFNMHHVDRRSSSTKDSDDNDTPLAVLTTRLSHAGALTCDSTPAETATTSNTQVAPDSARLAEV